MFSITQMIKYSTTSITHTAMQFGDKEINTISEFLDLFLCVLIQLKGVKWLKSVFLYQGTWTGGWIWTLKPNLIIIQCFNYLYTQDIEIFQITKTSVAGWAVNLQFYQTPDVVGVGFGGWGDVCICKSIQRLQKQDILVHIHLHLSRCPLLHQSLQPPCITNY